MIEDNISVLLDKGVSMPLPESVFIAEDVDLARISGSGVTLYPGTRIMGKDTLIMAGAQLGFEAPVTLENVFVGPDTQLKGGFFQHCVFVGKNSFGSGAHVRGGTILEEEASAAHTVGLKQTILFPFVTLGSLINFCDCFMAGGTSRKDHSEVGSSYIHFNYTPNQDKATPSMMGNVHEGVMLNRRPIFLGGQGGLVGPCQLPFGTVTAAGTIWRKDVKEAGRLLVGGGKREISIPMRPGHYMGAKRIFTNNVRYIAALMALGEWYRHIRSLFFTTEMEKALLTGMLSTLQSGIDERLKRLDDFVMRLDRSLSVPLSSQPKRDEVSGSPIRLKKNGDEKEEKKSVNKHGWSPITPDHENNVSISTVKNTVERTIINGWPDFQAWLNRLNGCERLTDAIMDEMATSPDSFSSDLLSLPGMRDLFVIAVQKGMEKQGRNYVQVIQSLAASDADMGTQWLKGIQDAIEGNVILS